MCEEGREEDKDSEDWEDVQFGRKGDDIHAARVSAKYEGLMFYDADYDRVGMF